MLCQQRVLHSIFYGKIAEERFCKWTAWIADVLSDKNVPIQIWSTFYLPPQLGQRLWPHFKRVTRVKQLCCHFLSSCSRACRTHTNSANESSRCLGRGRDGLIFWFSAGSFVLTNLFAKGCKTPEVLFGLVINVHPSQNQHHSESQVGKNLIFGELSLYVVRFVCRWHEKMTRDFTSFCSSDDCGLIWNLKWHQYGGV